MVLFVPSDRGDLADLKGLFEARDGTSHRQSIHNEQKAECSPVPWRRTRLGNERHVDRNPRPEHREHAMKAIVQNGYGAPDQVLELRETDKPLPKDDEVLVRVQAASLHPDVWHVVTGLPYVLRIMGAGLRRPKNPIPGIDMAGGVETIGKNVTRFQPGEEVFGETVRGHQWKNGGAFAEYVSVPEGRLESKPGDLSFEQAAAVPTSALIALQGVRHQGRVEVGQKVLVNGAGGGVGSFAVQLAKAYGATVTGVDDAAKLDTMRSIGADRVIDYSREDFTTIGERYDVIVDIPGNRSISDYRSALTPTGTYVLIGHEGFKGSRGRWIGTSIPRILKLTALSPFIRQRINPRIAKEPEEPLAVIKSFLESGRLEPVIDSTYPLGEVPVALHHLETGRVQGKIVITI